MPDRYSTFAVREGTQLSTELGFMANSIVVDNTTLSYLFVAAVGRWVPPNTYAAVFPLGAAVQVAQALWTTPPGVIPPVTTNLGQAQVVFTSAFLAFNPGQQLVAPAAQIPTLAHQLSFVANPTQPVITLAGVPGKRNQIWSITTSYNGALTAPFQVSVQDDLDTGPFAPTIWFMFIGTSVTHITFPGAPINGTLGGKLTITAPAGAAGVTGALNVIYTVA